MGEAPGAAAVLGAAVLAKGGRRAGGGGVGEAVGEAVAGDAGEAQAEPLAGDAGEAVVGVVGVVGESGVGTRGGGVAHRGRLLEKMPPLKRKHGALQLLEHAIALDAACDDDG